MEKNAVRINLKPSLSIRLAVSRSLSDQLSTGAGRQS